jgi:asparagine synthase (glutamine-hydrolysing)
MYFHNCPSNIEFDHECKRLLSDIQYFDVLRSDRSISCHGLEARTPFLDRSFVHQYLSLPIEYRNFNNSQQIEKWLLRKSIEIMDNNLLPKEVLWRNKEAFSDGVSSQNRSWFEIIQEKLDDIYTDEKFEEKKNLFTFNTPQTKEQLYYRELFESFYQGKENVIPYFWMPKYNEVTDSSARSLEIYKKKNNLESNIEE